MFRVGDIERLVRRPPFMTVIRLVAQVSCRLDPLVSPGEDLDAQTLLVLHGHDLVGGRSSETVDRGRKSACVYVFACGDTRSTTHVKVFTPDSEADFMASESMYSDVPLGASGNCNDHLICSPCAGESRASTTIPTSCAGGQAEKNNKSSA